MKKVWKTLPKMFRAKSGISIDIQSIISNLLYWNIPWVYEIGPFISPAVSLKSGTWFQLIVIRIKYYIANITDSDGTIVLIKFRKALIILYVFSKSKVTWYTKLAIRVNHIIDVQHHHRLLGPIIKSPPQPKFSCNVIYISVTFTERKAS